MKVEVLIDYRERYFTQHLPQILKDEKDIICKSTNLQLGDFVLKRDNSPDIIIERKTITDLFSSLRDSRYREQKIRLLSHRNESNCIVVYILEGHIRGYASTYTASLERLANQLNGVITSLTFRDGIYVWQVNKEIETLEMIHSLAKKLTNNNFPINNTIPIQKNNRCQDLEYAQTLTKPLSKNKRENLTSSVYYSHMLQQMPGVSANITKRIIQEYEKLSELMLALHANGPNTLADLKITLNSGKERRIGKVISNRIYDLLLS